MSSEKASRKFQKELNAGAVSLVLLSVLQSQKEPAYGYEIAGLLDSMVDDAPPMNQAAVYPVLRSLEKQGLLSSRMVPSDAGPPRKYYQLTAAGCDALAEWKAVWRDTTSYVNAVLEVSDAKQTSDARGGLPRGTRSKPQAKNRSRS